MSERFTFGKHPAGELLVTCLPVITGFVVGVVEGGSEHYMTGGASGAIIGLFIGESMSRLMKELSPAIEKSNENIGRIFLRGRERFSMIARETSNIII